jgi:hypothetical protein
MIKSRRPRWTRHVACTGREQGHTRFQWGNLREGVHLEDPDVEDGILVKWILEKWGWGTDWLDLAQDRIRWRAVVNAVTNFRVA